MAPVRKGTANNATPKKATPAKTSAASRAVQTPKSSAKKSPKDSAVDRAVLPLPLSPAASEAPFASEAPELTKPKPVLNKRSSIKSASKAPDTKVVAGVKSGTEEELEPASTGSKNTSAGGLARVCTSFVLPVLLAIMAGLYFALDIPFGTRSFMLCAILFVSSCTPTIATYPVTCLSTASGPHN